jgi:hypothetical protein
MPDISVTDDQRERLERVQAHLAEDVAYGHVRPRDALAYLLDRFEAESTPESTESASPAHEAAEDAGDVEAEFEVRNGGAATASVAGGPTEERDDAPDAPDAATTSAAPESTDAAATADESSDDAETGDDDARLDSVMSLLDDNDDVWREADGGDAKYEVDLPDGETERARTKDDVRAVLFKHYR